MPNTDFSDKEYWKAIVLLGLNTATYKIALGKTLITLAESGSNIVTWEELSKHYLDEYINRLKDDMRPQLKDPQRRTKMERIIMELNGCNMTYDQAANKVAETGFNDVVPRFQTIGRDSEFAKEKFYDVKLHPILIQIRALFASCFDPPNLNGTSV